MSIGERIRFFRNLRGMTQKHLGIAVGFSEKTADVRIAQYEIGRRTPKNDLIYKLAEALEVSADALTVPNIESHNGVMNTLFALEDLYGFRIEKINDELCIRFDKGMNGNYISIVKLLSAWREQADKLKNREITREEYDNWRYNYSLGF